MYRPVIFGEVLWDVFPKGDLFLGGAPFNVAWHLRGFGLAPLFISRVGEDELGEDVRRRAEAWGLDGSGVQNDPEHATGRVEVELAGGSSEPTYTIVPDQAFDYIAAEGARAAVRSSVRSSPSPSPSSPPLLYHGTLALRSPESAAALAALTAATDVPVFVDLNLRSPWWQPATVARVLDRARWAKLNDAELDQLMKADHLSLEARARRFRARYDLAILFVTRGEDGSFAVLPDDQLVEVPATPVASFADTVGAGDAYTAVVLVGLLEGWPLADVVRRAGSFAAALCSQPGATAFAPDLYARTRETWNSNL